MSDDPTDPMAVPAGMRTYTVVFLVKGPTWSADESPAASERQARHLAHLHDLTLSGEIVFAGPFTDDGALRGIILFRGTPEEASSLMADDPAVRSGHLAVEVHPAFLPSLEALRVNYDA